MYTMFITILAHSLGIDKRMCQHRRVSHALVTVGDASKSMAQNGRLNGHPRGMAVQTAILNHTFQCVAKGNQSTRNSSVQIPADAIFFITMLTSPVLALWSGDASDTQRLL